MKKDVHKERNQGCLKGRRKIIMITCKSPIEKKYHSWKVIHCCFHWMCPNTLQSLFWLYCTTERCVQLSNKFDTDSELGYFIVCLRIFTTIYCVSNLLSCLHHLRSILLLNNIKHLIKVVSTLLITIELFVTFLSLCTISPYE